MLEQRQQRDRLGVIDEQIGEQQDELAVLGLAQRRADRNLRRHVPAPQLRMDAMRQTGVGRDQRRRATRRFQRFAQQ